MKTVTTYRIEKKMVRLQEGSQCRKPEPSPMTTVVTGEIWMQFVANKEESEKEQVL